MPIPKALLENEFDQCSIDSLVSSPRKLCEEVSSNIDYVIIKWPYSNIWSTYINEER